ncbi:hypothetical protein M513_04997, partial [Trichuris suis]
MRCAYVNTLFGSNACSEADSDAKSDCHTVYGWENRPSPRRAQRSETKRRHAKKQLSRVSSLANDHPSYAKGKRER